jgi:hypothetical protein
MPGGAVIDVGDPLPDLGILVTDSAGALAAAAGVVLTITKPDGTTTAPSRHHRLHRRLLRDLYDDDGGPVRRPLGGHHHHRWRGAGRLRADLGRLRHASSIVGLDDAKTYLRITGTGDDDALRDVLEAASDLCERYTRKVWRRSTVTAELHSGGTDVIYLRQAPVVSVTSVTDTGVAVSSSTYTLDAPTGRLFFGDTRSTGCWTAGQENISVTYVTGPPRGRAGVHPAGAAGPGRAPVGDAARRVEPAPQGRRRG